MDALNKLKAGFEQLWLPPDRKKAGDVLPSLKLTYDDILDAEARLNRFAPLIARLFPETEAAGGIIESPLTEIPRMKEALGLSGRLFLKRDSELPIAGSVKARGGIYEVLLHTEDILGEAVFSMSPDEIRARLSGYTVQVGSTGNLGLSIGIMSAALGYRAVVHMSNDAKEWKKALLREKGVTVVEYAGDYSSAVKKGREASDADPMSYFVDDENSAPLFLGYSVAALRLKKQLDEAGVAVDKEHPLNVFLPCGVGGAPGGVTFGLKHVFGDSVNCFFVEPTEAPCMLAAFITGAPIPVTELSLSGKTEADGLAVGTASKLVYDTVRDLVSGEITVKDDALFHYQNLLYRNEKLFIEPSSAAAFAFERFASPDIPSGENVTNIAWATGGRLVPESERRAQLAVRVAAAIIRRDGRILICQRPENKARGGLWEFPGGKLEYGETAEDALVRECREELGVDVKPKSLFLESFYDYPDISVRLSFLNSSLQDGEPRLLEHAAIKWVRPEELSEYDFCPADSGIVTRLVPGQGLIGGLTENADKEYAAFQSELIPGVDPDLVLGVRLPVMRKLARSFKGSDAAERFMFSLPHTYYDENMLHAILLSEIKDYDRAVYELSAFLPYVDNWAVCDTLRPKAFIKHRAELWELIPAYLASKHEYTVRFGVEMLKVHFLDEEYGLRAMELACSVKRDEYYIKMMKAWFFADAAIKRWDEAIGFIKSGFGDAELLKMTVRKCLDSFRIPEERKEIIRNIGKSY